MLCACSLALAAVGVSVAVAIGNLFLAPVLAIGLMFVPFWYIKTTETNYKKAISSELETALSIITTAYLRNEDIITSIEENMHYLNAPVKTVFESFISRIKLSNPDVTAALLEMKQQIDNEVFYEWCDSLILCQNDRSLKSTLTPIVNKLSNMRVVNADLEYLITEPRKEFITMAFLVIGKWKFRSSTYRASISATMEITPDDKNPTATGSVMKSGYGINQVVRASVSGNGEHTDVQNAVR